jgi:FkbH-like protein
MIVSHEERTARSCATANEPWRNIDATSGYQAWVDAARAFAAAPDFKPSRRLRIAHLATYTTELLFELLPLAAARHGIALDIVATPFGQIEQSLLGTQPALADGSVDYVIFAAAWQDLGLAHGRPTAQAETDAIERWSGLWDAASRAGARAIQIGFVPPATDPYGLAANLVEGSVTAAVGRLNAALAERARGKAVFVDAASVATQYGLRRWESPRHWYTSRMPCAMDALPELAMLIAGALAADSGLTRRCVVVDLDNTLWGGVLGEEGPHGVTLGEGARGEAFVQFQHYLHGLRARGIALAVASKNDLAAVQEMFRSNPAMVLHEEDFGCIVADWRPKSEQLADIARTLRLGYSSIVFVDDNPAETEQVRCELPDIEAITLPGQPSAYVARLAACPGLFVNAVAMSDSNRAASYEGLRRAEALKRETHSLDEFLASLEMVGTLQPFADTLTRAAQLVAKTNQFNLTGVRRTQAELARLLEDAAFHGLTLRLRDRFADHGVIGFVLVQVRGQEAHVDTLLLSCRVIGRTAEHMLVGAAAVWARERGCRELVGLYRPSDRNALVAEIYLQLGFRPDGVAADGARMFRLDLAAGTIPASSFIQEVAR